MIDVELSPYRLFYNRRAWYVLGHSSLHKSIRTFKLNLIRSLQVSDKRFVGGAVRISTRMNTSAGPGR